MGRTVRNDTIMVKFAFQSFVQERPYPNCVRDFVKPRTDEYRKLSLQWPYAEPFHFLEYLDQEQIVYETCSLDQADEHCCFPIGISFFDFGVNWRELIPSKVFEKNVLIWFYYSEGDNPEAIKLHLDQQLKDYRYHFTSANTAAEYINNFSYCADDELLYRLRNGSKGIEYHERPRSKKFTALCRTHKWWRATTMARIWQGNLHHKGYFSYNNSLDVGESELDNPVEIDSFDNLRNDTYNFLNACPFLADDYSSQWHNLYHNTVYEHHADSYLNLVLETHLDADQSGGTFLTEKTFKPIKHSQLFLIVGPPGSVAQLRKMGYRTFDTWIDHSYDSIENNTQRWNAVMREFERLCASDLHRIYVDCCASIENNQRLFLSSKSERLNRVLEKVSNEFS